MQPTLFLARHLYTAAETAVRDAEGHYRAAVSMAMGSDCESIRNNLDSLKTKIGILGLLIAKGYSRQPHAPNDTQEDMNG